jgi:hypothetical protein
VRPKEQRRYSTAEAHEVTMGTSQSAFHPLPMATADRNAERAIPSANESRSASRMAEGNPPPLGASRSGQSFRQPILYQVPSLPPAFPGACPNSC